MSNISFEEDAQIKLPTSLVELSDLATERWYNYSKNPTLENAAAHNEIASLYNSRVKFNALQIIKHGKTNVDAALFIEEGAELSTVPTLQLNRTPNTAATTTKAAPTAAPAQEGSIIHQILELHKAGKSNKEIIELGFNKSTVGRQVGEYKKRQSQNN